MAGLLKGLLRFLDPNSLVRQSWEAREGSISGKAFRDLVLRRMLWRLLVTCRHIALAPVYVLELAKLAVELDRIHHHPRRKARIGQDTVLDCVTWLVNGHNIEIGAFCKISAFSTVMAGTRAVVQIGDGTIIGPNVTICAINHGTADNNVPIRFQPWIDHPDGSIRIGAGVWIGAGAVLLPGTTIGDGAVIAAGAIVRGNVGARTIYQSRHEPVSRARPRIGP